jgi:hypothetical protein
MYELLIVDHGVQILQEWSPSSSMADFDCLIDDYFICKKHG